MNSLSIKLGYWSALLSAITFIVFTVCFVAILLVSPLFLWTDLADYAVYTNENPQIFKYVAQFMMLLFCPLFVVLLNSIYAYTTDDKKILAQISVGFGLGFAVLVSINYFVQLSVVQQNVAKGNLVGIEQFLQANPASAITAVNMLGWTLFLGLASLFAAPVFSGGRLEKSIRAAFVANGIFCLLAGIGFILGSTVVVFVTINFGMGAAVTVATILLAVLFRKLAEPTLITAV